MKTQSLDADLPMPRQAAFPFLAGRLWPLLLLIGTFTGCGKHADRVVVFGAVTFNGAPIRQGQIRFFPEATSDAPMSGATIIDGRYTADAKGGVPVGTQRVEIVAFGEPAASARPGSAPIAAAAAALAKKQFLPPQFNERTTLTMHVPAGTESLTQDFVLTGSPAR